MLIATAVAALWGVNFLFIDLGLRHLPPLLFCALRFVLAAFPAVLLVGRPRVAWRWIVIVGLLMGVGQFGLLFIGMYAGMPAGLSSLVMQTQALFTIGFAALLLGERLRPVQLGGIGVAFGGLLLVAVDLGKTSPLGAFALLIVAASMWGLANVAIRKARPDDTFRFMVWISVVPPLPLLGLSLIFEGARADIAALTHITWEAVVAVTFVSLVSTLLCFGLWGRLLRAYDASVVAPYSLLVPVFGMSAAALLLGEPVGWVRAIAAALIIAGVFTARTGAA